MLYDDPDATDLKDRGLIKALNEKVQEDPNYPIPEGFYKQVEKLPIYDYRVPELVVPQIGEDKALVVEVFD